MSPESTVFLLQLYEEAKKMSNITVKLGHKMKSVDMEKKMLTFVVLLLTRVQCA